MSQYSIVKAMLAAGMLVVAACSQTSSNKADEPRNLATANPAAVYCLSLNGKLESVKNVQGLTNYCQLPEGQRIEEWQLFRLHHRA